MGGRNGVLERSRGVEGVEKSLDGFKIQGVVNTGLLGRAPRGKPRKSQKRGG